MESSDGQAAFVWRFAQAEFDELRWELRVDGAPVVPIEPRPLDVLLHLLRHAGEVVSREELLEAVYGHQHISDNALTNAIGKLRRALGDDAQAIIATVHRIGYRLAVPVTRTLVRGPQQRPLALRAGDPVPKRPHWRLVRPLGSGRDVEVWLAEQAKTHEQRVYKFSPDGLKLSALKREATLFRVIRETLGDRSDFVRLIDWNFEEMPFFLECEYGGQNLAEWAEHAGGLGSIPLNRRVDLAAQIADALAAAHSAGVLHKDLKPANVLMYQDTAGRWRPRLTDFGSGNLVDPARLAELGITRLGFTQTQAISADSRTGTLLYLAPEVLAGQPPTALSDVYALGVMLHQLVAADLQRIMAPGWELEIDDDVLRRDIAEAAAGDPAKRLASAADLALRLRRLDERRQALRHERETTQRLERARVRRPWLIAASCALAVGLLASLWFYRGAVRARDEARQQSQVAEGVTAFMTERVLGQASQYDLASRRSLTVLQAIDQAAAGLDSGRKPAPLTEAAIRGSLAQVYTQMSNRWAAEKQARIAAGLYRSALGPSDKWTLAEEHLLAINLVWDDKFSEAGAVLDQVDAVISSGATVPPNRLLAQEAIRGAQYYYSEQYEKAIPEYEAALALHDRLFPDDAAGRGTRRAMLAFSYARLGRFADADRLLKASLEEIDRLQPADPGAMALAHESYGISLYLQRRYPEAEQMLTRARDDYAKDGDSGPESASESLAYLGLVYRQTGRAEQAEQLCRAAYAGYLRRYDAGSLAALRYRGDIGLAELSAGDTSAALDDLTKAESGVEGILGANAPTTQYLRYYVVKAQIVGGSPSAETQRLLGTLDPQVLARELPDEDWSARLGLLHSQLPFSSGHKAVGLDLSRSARGEWGGPRQGPKARSIADFKASSV